MIARNRRVAMPYHKSDDLLLVALGVGAILVPIFILVGFLVFGIKTHLMGCEIRKIEHRLEKLESTVNPVSLETSGSVLVVR